MTKEQIVNAAKRLKTRQDLFTLLNRILSTDDSPSEEEINLSDFYHCCNPNKTDKSYISFEIPKKRGGTRTICAPTGHLKYFQHSSNKLLSAIYEPADCVMGFVPKKSVVSNASKHVGMKYIFNLDLQDFFTNIPQARIWAVLQLKPFSFNKDVASAIAGLCCKRELIDNSSLRKRYRYFLPQGGPTSPILSNIVCQKLDRKLDALARRFHANYTRYADDITFSSMNYLYNPNKPFIIELRKIIEQESFIINESKVRLQGKGQRQSVTGLVISEKVNVPREYTRNIQSLLYIWEKYGKKSCMKKIGLSTYPKLLHLFLGKLSYLKLIKGEDDCVYQRLKDRFCMLLQQDS